MSRDGVTFGAWSIPESELEETFDTPGGPGGQHANRNRTAVSLRLDISNSSLPESVQKHLIAKLGGALVETTAADSRSQWRNRAIARQRLAALLEQASKRDSPRRPTRPSRASKEKRLHEKQRKSEVKNTRRNPEMDD
jgi:ribosome-associated protein